VLSRHQFEVVVATLADPFLGPLIAARTHVQSTLERELYHPLERLHRAVCACRKETAFDYEDALIALECWPVNDAAQKFPLSELFEKLSHFEFRPATTTCESGECRRSFKRSVEIAIDRAKQSFQGLCLDCMKRSKPDVGQRHEEYIKNNSPQVGCWDMDCRFGHGRPSWYVSSRRVIRVHILLTRVRFYSWMGPSSIRKHILDKHRSGLREKDTREGKGAGIRRPRQAPVTTGRSAHVYVHGHGAVSSLLQGATQAASGNSNKENDHDDHDNRIHDMDDDDQFFDAEEETYLDGPYSQ
jgi:hypothetical protein